MKTFAEFWPFYLEQHKNPINRYLHTFGTLTALICLLAAIVLDVRLLILAPVAGYFFAWLGHFCFEKNRPATFRFPFWSILGDFKMCALILLRKL